MAQVFLNTGTQAANFEDLVNFITRVSPEQTQFYSAIGTTKAKAILHEWPTQALRAAASNAQNEGFTPTPAAGDITVRVRRTNPLQIIAQAFGVSGTQEEVDKAGLGQGSEFEYQKMLKFKEIAKDCDLELIQSVRVTRAADTPTAGEMDGLLAWAPAGTSIDAGGDVLGQDLFNEGAQSIVDASDETADTVFCIGYQRSQISKWTINFKEHMSKDTTLVDTVERYKGDWGTQQIIWDLQMPTAQIAIVRLEYLKKAFLRAPFFKPLPDTIDGKRGWVGMELTLEAQNPNTVGRVYNLATAA